MKTPALVSSLLLTVAAVTAQTAQTQDGRLLPQWLTGIIAVSTFLFLVFVGVLVKKAWCEESSSNRIIKESERENQFVMTIGNTYDSRLDSVRSKENKNAYDNLMIDTTEDRVTAM